MSTPPSLLFPLFLLAFATFPSPSTSREYVPTADHVVISDGTEIRLHSRSSLKTSASLGIKSSNKITSIDFFQPRNNTIDIVWVDAEGGKLYHDSIDMTRESISHRETITGQLLSNISSIAVLQNLPDRVVVTSHCNAEGVGHIVATNLDTRRDCLWVHDVIKPDQITAGSFNLSYQVFWISNRTCVQGLSLNGSKTTILCKHDLRNDFSDDVSLESMSVMNDQLYLILSNGKVYRIKIGSKIEFNEIEFTNDRSSGFNHIDIVQFSDGHEFFVSNKIDGTIRLVAFSDRMKFFNSSVVAVERSIFDFKVIKTKKASNDLRVGCFSNIDEKQDDRSGKDEGLEAVVEVVEIIVTDGDESSPIINYELCLLLIMSIVILILIALYFIYQRNREQPIRLIGNNISSSLEDPIIKVSGNNKCISIEDFGGFVNPGWNAAHQVSNPCDSCDYKEECSERGMCLNTFRLLHDHRT